MTGVSILTASLEAKRVELLHELIPNAAVIAALVNPTFSEAESQLQVVQAAANKLGRQIRVLNASSEGEIDSAFADLIQHHVDALLVTSDLLRRTRETYRSGSAPCRADDRLYS
jgi:putative ABC transport system substrate-binding protein